MARKVTAPFGVLRIAVVAALACMVCTPVAAILLTKPVPEIWIIPHSHDDTGWQRTVDQYHAEDVRYILTNTVRSLLRNRNRTFVEVSGPLRHEFDPTCVIYTRTLCTQVEIAFFKRWWDEQDDATKADVKQLVANGQLEFINGGWCMADEAVTHYDGLVNQLTLGHNFLKNEVGVIPRIGWSIGA